MFNNSNYVYSDDFLGSNVDFPEFDYNSFYRAYVESIEDPEKLGRVKVRIPHLHQNVKTEMLPFAYPATMSGAGNQVGQFILPPVGSVVFVTFEYSDEHRPIYFGGVITNYVEGKEPQYYGHRVNKGLPKLVTEDDLPIEYTGSQYIIYKSPSGSIIYIDDVDLGPEIVVKDSIGQEIRFTSNDIKDREVDGAVYIKHNEDNLIKVGKDSVVIRVAGVDYEAPFSGGGSGTSDFRLLVNKPKIDTSNVSSLPTSEDEELRETLKLHKVSKTGRASDLVDYNSLENKLNKVALLTDESTDIQYPSAKSVYDFVIDSFASMPTGLQVPIVIEKESDLPETSTAGVFYHILDMDILAPNRTGMAWWSDDQWFKVVDRYEDMDGVSLVKNSQDAWQVDSSWLKQTLNLSLVAYSGSYDDLVDQPFIPTHTSELVNDAKFITIIEVPTADWNATEGKAAILNKPTTLSGYGIEDAYTKTETQDTIANSMGTLELTVQQVRGDLDDVVETQTTFTGTISDMQEDLDGVVSDLGTTMELTSTLKTGLTSVTADVNTQKITISEIEEDLSQEILDREAQNEATLDSAKEYADTTASNAQEAAQGYADVKAEAERILAESYADGLLDAEELARIEDVTNRLQEAKDYADSAKAEALEAANLFTEAKLVNYIDAISYDQDISSLQEQIDGSITTWFMEYNPSTSNEPANSWTTEELRNRHLGDLFYNTLTGRAFRYQLSDGVYSWAVITDTDVTRALSDAAEAKDLADSKRRVFYNQPTPPYDIGDLWTQGVDGDLMRCAIERQVGTYVESDWEKATKYVSPDEVEVIVDDKLVTAEFEKRTSKLEADMYGVTGKFSSLVETYDVLNVNLFGNEENEGSLELLLEDAQNYADGLDFESRKYTNAQIEISEGKITSAVEDTYETKEGSLSKYANIQHTVDAVTYEFGEISTINFLRNSSGLNGTKFWGREVGLPYIESITMPTGTHLLGQYWFNPSIVLADKTGQMYQYNGSIWVEVDTSRTVIEDEFNRLVPVGINPTHGIHTINSTNFDGDDLRHNLTSRAGFRLFDNRDYSDYTKQVAMYSYPFDINKGKIYNMAFKLNNNLSRGSIVVGYGQYNKYVRGEYDIPSSLLHESSILIENFESRGSWDPRKIDINLEDQESLLTGTVSTSTPTVVETGAFWLDSSDFTLYSYIDGTWEEYPVDSFDLITSTFMDKDTNEIYMHRTSTGWQVSQLSYDDYSARQLGIYVKVIPDKLTHSQSTEPVVDSMSYWHNTSNGKIYKSTFGRIVLKLLESSVPPSSDSGNDVVWYCTNSFGDYRLGRLYIYRGGSWVDFNMTRDKFLSLSPVYSYFFTGWEETDLIYSEVQAMGGLILPQGDVYIGDMRVTVGDFMKDWSPATGEVYGRTTKIDSDGLVIGTVDGKNVMMINESEIAATSLEEENIVDVFRISGYKTYLRETIMSHNFTLGKIISTVLDDGVDEYYLD